MIDLIPVASRSPALAHYYANRAQLIERNRAWKAANKERVAKKAKEWQLANSTEERKAKNSAREAQWRQANASRKVENDKKWREANPDRRNTDAARHQRSADQNRRRVRLLTADGSHTVHEWHAVVALFGGLCVYCGEEKKLTRDHKTPLSRGGSDGIENIVPACLSCNSRKGRKTAEEFIAMNND